MNKDWNHFKTIADGEYCEIEGVNIWDYEWKSDYETIIVKDPLYGETKSLNRFRIELLNNKVEFAAGEFSNSVWGIYIKTPILTKKAIDLKLENNRIIFQLLKKFLDEYFQDNYEESRQYDDCYYILIYSREEEDSPIWFEFDIGNSELIVGYGISHIHYGEQYGIEISEGLNHLLDLFTSKRRRTDYYLSLIHI